MARSKILSLGLEADNFDLSKWGQETFERLYVIPHDEWLEMCIKTYFEKLENHYTSKRNGKWIIRKDKNKWLVFNKQGNIVIGYPIYVERCLSYIKELDEWRK